MSYGDDGTRNATDATNAQIAVTPSCSVTCLTSACATPVHDVPVLRGADHETTKANTPMADNDVLIIVVGLGLIALTIKDGGLSAFACPQCQTPR